jgi:hypothetical protein
VNREDLFIAALRLLSVDDDGITEADPTDMAAILQTSEYLVARTPTDNPYQLALHRLCIITAALIAGCQLGIRREGLGRDWLVARGELLDLRLAVND